jgi:hypothetical protein
MFNRSGCGLIKTAILLVSLLASLLPSFAASAQNNMRIIDSFTVVDANKLRSFPAKSTVAFPNDPEKGPIWVVLSYTGQLVDPLKDGLMVLEVSPEGVPLVSMDSFSQFESQHMTPYLIDGVAPMISLVPVVAGVPPIMSQSEIMQKMSPEELARYKATFTDPQRLLQLIRTNTFVVPKSRGARLLFTLSKIENMNFGTLQVIVGQGDIPQELVGYIEGRNGSWTYRYRYMLAFIAGVIVLGFGVRRFFSR